MRRGKPDVDDGPARRPAARGRAARAGPQPLQAARGLGLHPLAGGGARLPLPLGGSLGRGVWRPATSTSVRSSRRRATTWRVPVGASALRFSSPAGRLDRALAEARQATELSRPIKDPQSLNPALAFHSRTRWPPGSVAEADAIADELVEPGARAGSGNRTSFRWRLDFPRARPLGAGARGDRRRSRAHRPVARGGPANCLGRPRSAPRSRSSAIGSVPDEAYARLKAAEAFVAVGNRAEADGQLRLALPVFAQLGASAWTAEAEALLAESA